MDLTLRHGPSHAACVRALPCCRLRSVRIDGSVSPDERQAIVDAFNQHGIGQVRSPTGTAALLPVLACVFHVLVLAWLGRRQRVHHKPGRGRVTH